MLSKYVKQQIQAEGDVILNCSGEAFQASLEQRIHSCKEEDMELVNRNLLQAAETKAYLGWVGKDSFIIRPVHADKAEAMNRFIIEGTFSSREGQTFVKFLIRPDFAGRLRWKMMLLISLLPVEMFVLLQVSSNLFLMLSALAIGFIAITYAIIKIINPFLPECKTRFTQLLRSLYFN